jgi:hypothetical protein
MSTMPATPARIAGTSVPDPRQTFESAIAQIQKSSPAATPYRTPIALRRRPNTSLPSDGTTEKQALADAARALARRWNVSPTRVR